MKNYFFFSTMLFLALFTTVNFSSCGGDDDGASEIAIGEITLYAGASTTIAGAKSIVPDNKFVATVSDNLEVKGWHVGQTNLTINGKIKRPITVRGRYHFYDDPITDWGTSMSNVKSKQKQGTLYNETDKALVFQNVGSADLLAYAFENGKLIGALAQVKTSYTTSLMNYINERYVILPEEVATYTYMGADGLDETTMKTVVMIEVKSASSIIVYYLPYSKTKKAPETEAQKLRKRLML